MRGCEFPSASSRGHRKRACVVAITTMRTGHTGPKNSQQCCIDPSSRQPLCAGRFAYSSEGVFDGMTVLVGQLVEEEFPDGFGVGWPSLCEHLLA